MKMTTKDAIAALRLIEMKHGVIHFDVLQITDLCEKAYQLNFTDDATRFGASVGIDEVENFNSIIGRANHHLCNQILEYTKSPDTGSKDYGKWGALNREQRRTMREVAEYSLHVEEVLDNAMIFIDELYWKTFDVNADCYRGVEVLDKIAELKEKYGL